MKTANQTFRTGRIIGDILIVLAVILTADVIIVMHRRINGVVLKTDYTAIFRYELIICAILLLFATDVRFNLFTRWRPVAARIAGRAVLSLRSLW